MNVTTSDRRPPHDYLAARRLELHIRREARRRGLTGDPLDEPASVADTAHEQLAAINLYLSVPAPLRRSALAWPMALATVTGRATR